MRIAYVTFNDNGNTKEYAYKCPFSARIGDTAIVDSPYNGLVRVTIRRFGNRDARATKSLLGVEDTSAIVAERQRAARKTEIESRLQEIHREVLREEKLALLARKSPEAKRLVRELKELSR